MYVLLIAVNSPSTPNNFRITDVQLRSISIAWERNEDSGRVDNFTIQYSCARPCDTPVNQMEVLVGSEVQIYTLSDLHEGMSCAISIFASNSRVEGTVQNSNPSQTLRVSTLLAGDKFY